MNKKKYRILISIAACITRTDTQHICKWNKQQKNEELQSTPTLKESETLKSNVKRQQFAASALLQFIFCSDCKINSVISVCVIYFLFLLQKIAHKSFRILVFFILNYIFTQSFSLLGQRSCLVFMEHQTSRSWNGTNDGKINTI